MPSGPPVVELPTMGLVRRHLEPNPKQFFKLMKPTTQISSSHRKQRSFPLTDYQYQTSLQSADRAVARKNASRARTANLSQTEHRIFCHRSTTQLCRRTSLLYPNRWNRSLADH